MVLMLNFWNFSFFGRGDVSPTHSELCRFVSGSYAKRQVSSPVIILLKKFLSSAIAIVSWQDVIRSFPCSGVKKCGTKRANNFLFPKSSFRIRRSFLTKSANSNNVYLSSSRLWMATSLAIFYQPSISKSRIPPKNV